MRDILLEVIMRDRWEQSSWTADTDLLTIAPDHDVPPAGRAGDQDRSRREINDIGHLHSFLHIFGFIEHRSELVAARA